MSGKNDPKNSRNKLVQLMEKMLSGDIHIEDFTAEYRRLWTFGIDKSNLNLGEIRVFQDIADKLNWYSPFAGQKGCPSCFKDKDYIIDSISQVRKSLVGSEN